MLSGSLGQVFVGSVNVMVVGTNSPLILLMPEVGLLYILSSSDPLCGGEGQVRHSETNTQTKPNTPMANVARLPTLISATCVLSLGGGLGPKRLLYLADSA